MPAKDDFVQDNASHSIDMVLPWILGSDPLNPGVRFFALRDLPGRPRDDSEFLKAQEAIMQAGPMPAILDAQHPEGYRARPGGGHAPSYTATVLQIIFLAELGASVSDERVQRGCDYLLDHVVSTNGSFAMNPRPVPSSVVHCRNGDPLHALLQLGYPNDARVRRALDWQVQAITGEGDVRFYRSGTSGRGFACAYNQKQPCAWAATKALKALRAVPVVKRTADTLRAIDVGTTSYWVVISPRQTTHVPNGSTHPGLPLAFP